MHLKSYQIDGDCFALAPRISQPPASTGRGDDGPSLIEPIEGEAIANLSPAE